MDILKHNIILEYHTKEVKEQKKFGKGLLLVSEAAENRAIEAQFNLALLYEMEKNLEKAFYWYQKAAAENGHIKAQYNLGILYKEGEGTEKNLEKAFYWYQKAAENEGIEAQFNLALLYETEKNLEKAFYWYQKAAENGNNNAQCNLGCLYHVGEGTEKNLEMAFLGCLYHEGEVNLEMAFY